jgi:hypothetical protein
VAGAQVEDTIRRTAEKWLPDTPPHWAQAKREVLHEVRDLHEKRWLGSDPLTYERNEPGHRSYRSTFVLAMYEQ